MRGYVVITLPAASLRMLKFFQLRQRNANEDPRLRAKTLTKKFVSLIKDMKNGDRKALEQNVLKFGAVIGLI